MTDTLLRPDQRPPAAARIVVLGGGIMGCSTAYHLAQLGQTDVVLLEQGQLTCGTTWHAAGLVGQLRAHESMTRLIRYSTDLYARLEAETGLATGWNACGSLAVARTADRLVQLKRTAAVARAYGVACEVLSAQEAGARYPLMRTDDLAGAVWLPGDGKANPADLTLALAKGARQRGVRIVEGVRVTGVEVAHSAAGRRVTGVQWTARNGNTGATAADIVVNCGGQWARALGRQVGVTVPLFTCEHYYIVTDRIDGVTRELPVLRDPDGYIYFKEEVGGLLMGGFEPKATPWLQAAARRGGIPHPFEFELLPDNWDAFQVLLDNALVRVPAMESARVKKFYNGPESFTADNNFILGEAPGLNGYFVGAGFNSMGIASGGGAGRALAEWIVQGEPTLDLWPVDIRRFAAFHGNEHWLPDRIAEVLGMHYQMPWPNRELESARPLRRSPLYGALQAAGACFGSKMGWERPNFFAPTAGEARIEYGWGHQNWHPWVAAEHRACREAVALFDMSSFAKLAIGGADAERVLNWIAANDVAVAVGRTVYTGLLNTRAGYESDCTITRTGDDAFLLVTGSAQAVRDLDLLERAIARRFADARVSVNDVTTQFAVLALMGPRAPALLAQVTGEDLSEAAFPFGTSRLLDVGHATVRATRLTYVGEPGWELYVPVEFAAGVYETLHAAGAAHGLINAGYYAIEGLRLEKGYRAWGRELTPDIDPFEAGLSFAVAFDKPDFRGRDAVLARRAAGGTRACTRRIVSLVVDAPHTNLWGGELVLRDGAAAGFVTSAAFGHTVGRPVALALVTRADGPADGGWIDSGRWSIDLAGQTFAAQASLRAPLRA